MLLNLILILCVTGALTQGTTRVAQIDIDSALNRDNIVVLTGLRVYRDEIVVLDTYGGVITVGAVDLTVRQSLFDTINLSHVYSTVDDDMGYVGSCTNRKGRCQYMDINTLQVLGYGDGLVLEGDQGEAVDLGVLLVFANTSNNVPSLYTASGNGITIGQTDQNPMYPIRATQLAANNLVLDALLLAIAQSTSFNRNYISMLRAEGYVYIVSDDGVDIRVTRICESDNLLLNRFHSLYQVILSPCVTAGTPIVLDARLSVFNDSSESNYLVVTYKFLTMVSVCAYSLSSINQAMRDTYESCVVNEIGSIPNEALFGSIATLPCSLYSDPNINTECNLWTIVGESDTNRVFLDAGTVTSGTELISYVVVSVEQTHVTTTAINDSGYSYYYLYLVRGNSISKYLLNGVVLVQPPLETLVLSDTITAVERDQSGANLFAITSSLLYRIPLDDCARHSSCSDCVSDPDPLCGWCSLQSECSRRSLCSQHALVGRWIQTDSGACLAVTSVTPDTSPLNRDTNVTLRAVNLPELIVGGYECVFSEGGTNYTLPVTAVNGNTNSIKGPVNGTANMTCAVPTGVSSFTESDTRVYSLHLSTSAYNARLGDTLLYSLVQCGFNSNCSGCVASTAACGWCLYDSSCVAERISCFMEEWVQPTDSPTLCPIVLSTFNTSTLQVAAQEVGNITLQGANLPAPTLVYTYRCALTLTGEGRGGVPGVWRNTSGATAEIDCLVSMDTFATDGTGSVQLVWGPSNHSINQGTLEFNVFICGNQLDCMGCVSNSECNWCASADNRSGECSSACAASTNIVRSSEMCPRAQISAFLPNSTAVGGSVAIEVTGYNMFVSGRVTSVKIGDIYCSVTTANNTYVRCQLQASTEERSDPLNLTVAGLSALSNTSFETAQPVITRISPIFTPQTGGSRVTLSGDKLLVGSSREVTAGEVQCEITHTPYNATEDTIVCIMGASPSPSSPLMSIRIDSVDTSYLPESLMVLADPQVTNVYLGGVGTEQQLRGTVEAGAIDYQLGGRNLGATLTQWLVFMQGETEISRSLCTPPADSTAIRLECPGAGFYNVTSSIEGTDVRFDLIMDAVPNVTQLFFQVFAFKLYPNPMFVGGAETIQQAITVGDTEIMFEIPNIDRVPSEVISIKQTFNNQTVNPYICSSIQITETGIRCSLNTTTTTTTNNELEIQIEIGLNNNRYELRSTLTITQKPVILSFLEMNLAPLIGAGVVLLVCMCLLCLFLCVCCCFLGRSRRSTRIKREEAEHLLAEMEDIENDLADKCRKGFTELNTQIGLDEGSLVLGTIPIHNFKTFAMRILFPGLQDHPILHPVEKPRNMDTALFETGLHKFERLLHDRTFLIALIRSMEENRNFSVRDRCNVASLLTVALHGDMPYLTEVLFELMEELINRNITRNTSKLLLRRTESVAEKLLADWLAFNLFPHLQGPPSVAMYRLFLGLKGHLEAGPVDVLNGSAAHSLSEEKLMRQEVAFNKLEVEAEAEDGSRLPCKLLDCDTITQTKIKLMDTLYRGVGCSRRPKLEDVEVELRSAGGGRLQLRDSDMTNEGDEEWRRINTLAHYHIRSGMVLGVVHRKHKPNPGQVWDYPGTSIYDFGHTQSLARLLSLDEESSKVYHLQKSEEVEEYQEQRSTLRRRQYGSEIFLPKLVATKRILQSYIDQLIEDIFPDEKAGEVPRAIKVLYDFLDAQGTLYGVEDPEVLHTWKNNSVPLRFWVNLLKNPEFLLDVAKSAAHDAALSVISQAFIDGCSTGTTYITRDSPTNKLLYHKEVQTYKARVKRYYEGIRNAPTVDKNSLVFNTADFLEEGETHIFHVDSAVYGLFSYAQSYQEGIKARLSADNMDILQQSFEEVCLDIAENLYMA